MPDDSPLAFRAGRTALIVEVPEAETAVGDWRARYDTSAAAGVPPHVTILFPFLPTPVLRPADRSDLAALIGAEPGFAITFDSFGEFPGAPGVLYLEPSPAEPLRRLTSAIAAHWSQCPPYAGAFDDPVPHLTVTETAPPQQMSAARRDVGPLLPIRAEVVSINLLVFDGTLWRRRESFRLGPSAPTQ